MKVTISNKPEEVKQKGLFAKPKTRYFVVCKIEFNEEERAIILGSNLSDVAVETTTYNDSRLDNPLIFKTTFKDLLDGKSLSGGYDTPVEAHNYEQQLRTDTLPNLKNYLMASKAEPSSETFEL